MAKIVDKTCLLLLGVVLVSQSEGAAPVVAMLLGVIAAALGIGITDWKGRSVYMVLFLLGCLLLPELLYFLPVLFYDCAMERRAWIIFGSVPLLTLYYRGGARAAFFMGKGAQSAFWYVDGGQIMLQGFGIWVVFLAAAVVLGRRTGRMEQLEHEMIRLRDTSTELNLVLREKNKSLIEKQDYEIYLATLRERNRIAREIHDNVGHMLSRSILQVGALTTVHKEEPLHGQLASVNETLDQAMNSIRESVHDLHDDAIDLRQAVTEATRAVNENYQVTIDYDMTPEIPRNVKYCFIATVKEAVSNILKHSNGDRIVVILREHPGFYQLTVEDNGTTGGSVRSEMPEAGCQRGPSGGKGIGISNMRERVEALHGTFRIHREKGFQIFISIPKIKAS